MVCNGGEDLSRLLLVEDDPRVVRFVRRGLTAEGYAVDVAENGDARSSALERDWQGLGRDTAFFVGYEAVAAGILYLLPEQVTQWTADQRRTSLQRWWENVRQPQWDPDHWYVNYLGHPYFGAIAYVRARERRFGALGGSGYAAVLSGLYEFGIEAMFERPSYQDLIMTPVGGLLVGALLFEPIREYILRKPELRWYDHIPLALTDPLGVSNAIFERLLGIPTDIRVQVRLPTSTQQMRFDEPTARSLNRPLEHQRQAPGMQDPVELPQAVARLGQVADHFDGEQKVELLRLVGQLLHVPQKDLRPRVQGTGILDHTRRGVQPGAVEDD